MPKVACCDLALLAFPRLKRLSWIGLASDEDIATLSEVLVQRSRQLEEFQLDLLYHRGLEKDDFHYDSEGEVDLLLTRNIVQIRGGVATVTFPALKALSLAGISFVRAKSMVREKKVLEAISTAFDFSSLRSLKLYHCEGWDSLLEHLTNSSHKLRLASLEIQTDYCDIVTSRRAGDTIAAFLRSFGSLKELSLYTAAHENTLDICLSALHHQDTLKRLVYHQRTINLDDKSGGYEGKWIRPIWESLSSK